MKKTLLLFGLVTGSFIYAQNVGIETDNPQYTLDVEGSVRLSEPGEFVVNSKPLGIDNDTKQVVALEVSEDGDPFHVKRYTFSYSAGTGIGYYDLGINYNTHDVMLVGADLVRVNGLGARIGVPNISAVGIADQNIIKENGSFGVVGNRSYKQDLVTIILQGISNATRGITEKRPDGRHYVLQGSMTGGLIYPDKKYTHQSPSYSQITATIEKGIRNTNWFFSGGTQISTLVEDGRAVWVVDVLIVNKNWVDSREIVEVNVGNDFKTLTRVKGTHPAVQ